MAPGISTALGFFHSLSRKPAQELSNYSRSPHQEIENHLRQIHSHRHHRQRYKKGAVFKQKLLSSLLQWNDISASGCHFTSFTGKLPFLLLLSLCHLKATPADNSPASKSAPVRSTKGAKSEVFYAISF